jgi:hypothetical protein
MWRKQRRVAKKFGYCHCNPRAFGQFNKGVPSSIWQQCHKLYLTKLDTIAPTTLLLGYRDYSPKNLVNGKSFLVVVFTFNYSPSNYNENEGQKCTKKV